jgi:GAF domain-containing protein
MLLLGDYVGEPTEHIEIPYGRGICGHVAESLKTYVSDDVTRESNYIACSASVRSEIVVPILKDGEFYGQLDIDSHTPAAFSAQHRQFLEELCRSIETSLV